MMRRFFLPFLLVVCGATPALAQLGSVPYSFSPGTTISSSKINSLFSAIYSNALNRTGGTMTGSLTTLGLLPTADNTSNLGSAALSYKDAWIEGTLTVGTISATTFSGGLTTTTIIQATVTTEQLRLRYDANNYLSVTVASNGGTTFNATSGSAGDIFTFSDVSAFTSGLKERGRSTLMGEWANYQAYSAGDYTQDAGTWTVGSGDVTVNRFTLIGKTVIWQFVLTNTTTATTPSSLRVAVPTGLTNAAFARGGSCGGTISNGSPTEPGYWEMASGGTYVSLFRSNSATWNDGTDNNTIRCTITFEIA